MSQVYVDWRGSWLTKLYQPQPVESNRVKRGELENRIEDSMVTHHTLFKQQQHTSQCMRGRLGTCAHAFLSLPLCSRYVVCSLLVVVVFLLFLFCFVLAFVIGSL